MKYYLDQEFSEHFKLGCNLRYYHTIELIQIGIKAEDGRTYTAINKNFNPKHCNAWVKQNVLQKMVRNYILTNREAESTVTAKLFDNKTIDQQFRTLQRLVGKSQKKIAAEIFEFINPNLGWHVGSYSNSDFRDPNSEYSKHFDLHNVDIVKDYYYAHPTFIGYFCQYDWVLFCSLFGTMADLPPGFPMYMVDLKQKLDETIIKTHLGGHNKHPEFNRVLNLIKEQLDYPKQTNEHDALADAEWNEQLDLFINKIMKNENAVQV